LLIGSGQNPLIAYAGVHSLVPPVLGLLALDVVIEGITPTPWLGALRGAGMTFLVALAADFCSRRGYSSGREAPGLTLRLTLYPLHVSHTIPSPRPPACL